MSRVITAFSPARPTSTSLGRRATREGGTTTLNCTYGRHETLGALSEND